MSRSVSYFFIFLFYLYILIVWGKIAFLVLAILGAGFYAYYSYYKKVSPGSWVSAVSAPVGGQKDSSISESKPKITFADVAGIDEAKEELLELVDFLKNKDIYLAAGARLPRGVLMAGPPGVGKTLSAKAIAGEANVPMIEMAGSSFVDKYVGIGARNIRALFQRAKVAAPCIIFIDEFDSLGKRGGGDTEAGHEYDQTINQLLVEMDGFSVNEGVIVLAATNRIDKVDEALLRPGRFDVKIYFNRPDMKGREEILKVHAVGKPLAKNVNLKDVAKSTPGLTGADLADIMNKAAIMIGKSRRTVIDQKDILAAKERLILGKEKKSMIIDKEEKEIIAVHEAGHALLAVLLPYCDPPDKVSIVPRDIGALGITALSPGKERYNVSKEFLCDQMAMLFGGRAAEKIACNTETAGAKDDIERATNIAMAMVCEYGMSEELGPIAVNAGKGGAWGSNVVFQANAQSEVMRLVKRSHDRAQDILSKNIPSLRAIAALLLDKETISGEEIIQLMEKPSS
ncbi:MAG: AAA family ATPase [Candidatus Taylorbacteria bacterium]|nr:AAA family ATPase [Candidatus Taylorbacteria bacterium]